jgi:hypothetical protein
MQDIGAFSPDASARIWRCVLDWEKTKTEKKDVLNTPFAAPIYVKNVGTNTVPPWGCMQVVGTDTLDNCVVFKVDRPLQLDKPKTFLLNGPKEIAANDYGTAQSGPKFRAIKDSTTITSGMRLGPVVSSFNLGKGCLFSYFGTDAIATDGIVAVRDETPILAKAGGSGISANSSGTVTARVPTSGGWSDGTVTYTAWAPTDSPVSANAQLMLFPVDARWVAVEICP